MYRAVNRLAPDYICSMFRPVSEVSSTATRASVRGDPCVPLGRICVSHNMVAHAGAIIWNSLSAHVRWCQSTSVQTGLHWLYYELTECNL